MNEPDADRLLRLLAQDPQPALSPYFETRLRGALEEDRRESARAVRIRRLVLGGGIVWLLFSVLVLWRYPYLRWLIPIVISQFLPEEWLPAVSSTKRQVLE